jgi:hypothetical protein
MEAPTAAIFRYQPANLMIRSAPSKSSREGVTGADGEGGGGGGEQAGGSTNARKIGGREAVEIWAVVSTIH